MEFEKLDLKHQQVFEKYKHLANPVSSVHNFTALYMWKDALGIEIYDSGTTLFMRRVMPPVFGFLPPLSLEEGGLVKALDEMRQYALANDYPLQMIDVEQWFLEKLEAQHISFVAEEDRDNSEYLYDGDKLRNLSGKKLHSKKNHYNNFTKNQNYETRPLKGNTHAALGMAKRWLEGKKSDYTVGELIGIESTFQHMDVLPVKGITVFVDGVCQAFTICEDTSATSVLVHVEKANDGITGLFTFVNSENMRINHPHAQIVNREQDLGIEGLRKAKLSWKPLGLVDKYIVKF
ncbi:MAG: phosphatidylglycerol lysyltransferase domain-containing protein [Clostridiaceae bacterium]